MGNSPLTTTLDSEPATVMLRDCCCHLSARKKSNNCSELTSCTARKNTQGVSVPELRTLRGCREHYIKQCLQKKPGSSLFYLFMQYYKVLHINRIFCHNFKNNENILQFLQQN